MIPTKNKMLVGYVMIAPIEGDIAVLKDGSIWVVKGCIHPKGCFIGMPRVLLSRSNYMMKVKRLSDALSVVYRYYRHYLSYIPEIGYIVPKVPLDDVREYITWRDTKVLHRLHLSELGRRSLELIHLVSKYCGTYCGPAGSLLGNYYSRASDIDVICYDSPKFIDCLHRLRDLSILEPLISKYFITELINVSEGLDESKHMRLVESKLLQGIFKGVKYTLRVVNCERISSLLGPYDYVVRPKLILCRVISNDYRTPSIYEVKIIKSYGYELLLSNPKYVANVITHRIRFSEIPRDSILVIKEPLVLAKDGALVINIDSSDYVNVILK